MNDKLATEGYVLSPDATLSDIDLDTEEFHYRGQPLTKAKAERLAEKVQGDSQRFGHVLRILGRHP